MRETAHFLNEGYGWMCKRCRDEGGQTAPPSSDTLPRFFREGEAEDRDVRLSTTTLARWKDDSRRTLLCPRCGAEEEI